MHQRKTKLKVARSTSYRAVALAVAIAACLPIMVEAANPEAVREASVRFDIPAGDLAVALERFSTQSGIQAMYRQELIAGKKSVAVKGALVPSDALRQLLSAAGLVYERVNERTYVLKDAPAKAPDKSRQKEARNQPEGGAESGHVTSLAEVLVNGKRSFNADIERTKDDIQPYVVFSKEEIETSMSGNLEEFLSRRLPMSQTMGTAAQDVTTNSRGNRSEFNLRGLGANQTLILINGRRMAGVAQLSGSRMDQPDLNGIPIAMVERVEVLPATASGIYGGSATAGVINVILKSEYKDGSVRFTYDNSFDTDSARQKASFTKGFSLEEGRTQLLLSGSYSESNELLARDRPFLERSRELLLSNLGDSALTRANMMRGNRANFSANPGTILTLRNGTSLGSGIGSVPIGYGGYQTDGGAGLVSGAGTFDFSIPESIPGKANSLISSPTTSSFMGSITREFTDNLRAFVEFGKTRNRTSMGYSTDAYSVTLLPTDAGNPFNNVVSVNFTAGVSSESEYFSDTDRVNAGFVYKLPGGWAVSVEANRNSSENKNTRTSIAYDSTAVQAEIRSGAIDVFRDTTMYPIDLSAFEVENLSAYGPSKGSTKEYVVRVGGPIASYAAGSASLTASLATRKDWASSARSRTVFYPARGQEVDSAYVEAFVPMVSSSQGIPFVSKLDGQVSVRHDRYATTAIPIGTNLPFDPITGEIPAYRYVTNGVSSTDYTVGLRYAPIEDLTFRGSFGTGFLPPSISQLGKSSSQYSVYLIDPMRDGVRTLYSGVENVRGGGDDSLKPETSQSISLGLIYTPSYAEWLRLSVDYIRIRKKDEIATLTPQQIVDLEAAFPDRVGRGANLPGDPAGWAGVINRIDASSVNVARSNVDAIDFQVDIDRDFGKFGSVHFYGVISKQNELSSRVLESSPWVDRIGYMDGILPVRGNVGVDWSIGQSTLSMNTQYYDSYHVYASTYPQSSRDQVTMWQGSDRIPSQSYADVNYRYSFDRGFLSGSWVSFGVRNVFNKMPPIVASSNPYGGYSTFGDPRLRTYVINFEMTF
ncbi:TonB-dependent receptor [Pseudoxanthomonas putridarboris]|uniref:TonB-dependent receptor n=1 Tax=Pseudoxanthomonas putridarboris TaxID=752605 RepID=A0ABU9IX09_9GAMM